MPAPAQVFAIAAAAGGRTIARQTIGGAPVSQLVFRDGWQAARALGGLAIADAQEPELRQLGAVFAQCFPDARARARCLLRFVQANVSFAREPVETFQSARVTLERRAGDCDDSARLLAALARCAGIPSRLAFLQTQGQPVHVFAELWTGSRYEAAETTIRGAELGEDPRAAARRLGVRLRPDLAQGEAIPMMGAIHDLAQTDKVWTLPQGPAAVRLALEVPFLQPVTDLADGLKAIGLTEIQIIDPRAARPLEWPATWIAMRPAEPSSTIRLAWGRYAGAPRQLARDVGDPKYTVRAAQTNDDATPPQGAADMTATPPPPPGPMPPATESRSAWARIVVANAWPKLYPGRPLTEAAADLVVAVASLETSILRNSQGAWNWGNLHGGKLAEGAACPPGRSKGYDTDGQDNRYATCFFDYPDAVAGMVEYLRVLTRGDALAALETGDPDKLAGAMKANRYYEAPTEKYAAALRANLATVQGKLDAAKTAAGSSWYVLPAVALLAAATWYASTRG